MLGEKCVQIVQIMAVYIRSCDLVNLLSPIVFHRRYVQWTNEQINDQPTDRPTDSSNSSNNNNDDDNNREILHQRSLRYDGISSSLTSETKKNTIPKDLDISSMLTKHNRFRLLAAIVFVLVFALSTARTHIFRTKNEKKSRGKKYAKAWWKCRELRSIARNFICLVCLLWSQF